MSDPVIDIQVTDDRMMAYVRDWSPFAESRDPVGLEELVRILAKKGIVDGICRSEIERAIESAMESGARIQHLVLARMDNFVLDMGHLGSTSDKLEAMAFKEKMIKVGAAIQAQFKKGESVELLYYSQGEVVLSMTLPSEKNIFGKRSSMFDPSQAFPTSPSLETTGTISTRTYRAKFNGYLHINSRGELDVFPLKHVSEDRLTFSLTLGTVKHGRQKLQEDTKVLLKAFGEDPSRGESLFTGLQEDRLETILVTRGMPPVPPSDAQVNYMIPKLSARPPMEKAGDESIDYRNQSRFITVMEGQVLAIKTLPMPGRDGIGVDGKPVLANYPAPRDIKVLLGENVEMVKREVGAAEFVSRIRGVVDLEEKVLAVHEKLVVHGDTGLGTGHLNYGGDIHVDGHVTSCTSINCGGGLMVSKNIENKSQISCQGDVVVMGGIYGVETNLKISGNLEVGFVHDATIEVDGDVVIHKYAFNSNIYASGNIRILGEGIKGNDARSVIGGVLNGKRSLSMHSVGSHTNKTSIVAGMDMRQWDSMQTARNYKKFLASRVAMLQEQLGLSDGAKNSGKAFKNLSTQEKESKKASLLQLKEYLGKLGQLDEKIVMLRQSVFSLDLQGESIEIQKELVPDVNLRIGPVELNIFEKIEGPRQWRIRGNELKPTNDIKQGGKI